MKENPPITVPPPADLFAYSFWPNQAHRIRPDLGFSGLIDSADFRPPPPFFGRKNG